MNASKKNVKDDSIKSPQQASSTGNKRRKRILLPPAKPGRIKQSIIKKAVREIIAERKNKIEQPVPS